jgi:adenosylcobyric acid synthase
VTGRMTIAPTTRVVGYEIHMGRSSGPALRHPALDLNGRPDGAVSSDGQVLATYVHGIFDHPEACAALLQWAGLQSPTLIDHDDLRERSLERLATALKTHLRMDELLAATLA